MPYEMAYNGDFSMTKERCSNFARGLNYPYFGLAAVSPYPSVTGHNEALPRRAWLRHQSAPTTFSRPLTRVAPCG